jgi:hypothetical protein
VKTGVMADTAITRAEIAIAQGRFDDAQAHAEHALAMAREAQGDMPPSPLASRTR